MMDDFASESVPASGRAGQNDGVVRSAFALIRVLARARRPMGVTSLAAAVGLPKTTAHRILEQLAREGVVTRRDHAWALGAGLGDLSQAPYRADLAGVAHVRMHALTRATGATLFLYVQAPGQPLNALSRTYGARVRGAVTAPEQRRAAEHPASAIWCALERGQLAAEYGEAHPEIDCIATAMTVPCGDTAILTLAEPSGVDLEPFKRPLDRTIALILSDLRRLEH
ncbi:helix-turn-helix domain-containing protein [Streptomyces sp. NPDC046977]|uniref:helix-turn-helix domain-containing protein n=1 Tax=Streptomyces sp. NPDC046977 TaxID=3154703 RepID=UPI003402C510